MALVWVLDQTLAMLLPILTYFFMGCSTTPAIDPDRTTYPHTLTRQQHVVMPLVPAEIAAGASVRAGDVSQQAVVAGRPFLEFQQTVVGDRAEHEVRIIRSETGTRDERSLLAAVPLVARRICGEGYSVNFTKYYNGTEATSKFLATNGPWLSTVIRCSLQLNTKGDAVAEALEAISKGIPEAEYFDISQKDFVVVPTELSVVLDKVLMARGMSIEKRFRWLNSEVIITNLTRSGIVGFPVYERIVSMIAKREGGTVLAVRLLAYNRDIGGELNARDGRVRLIPMRRDFVYQRVQRFLGEVSKTFESN